MMPQADAWVCLDGHGEIIGGPSSSALNAQADALTVRSSSIRAMILTLEVGDVHDIDKALRWRVLRHSEWRRQQQELAEMAVSS